MYDKLREHCGVFGIFGHPEAANLAYLGLHALQHRGQESAGIAVSNGTTLHDHRRPGLVSDSFDSQVLSQLVGCSAIGHVRYSTSGGSHASNIQPLVARWSGGNLAVAHNGNLVNAASLRAELESQGAIFQSSSDTEAIIHLVARSHEHSIPSRIAQSLRRVYGAYSLLFLTEHSLIGVRDPLGMRPLVLGRIGHGYVLASETCALDLIGARYIREIEPGEMVIIQEEGLRSTKPFDSFPKARCIFELIYFARPDSIHFGKSVYEVRKQLGRELAISHPVEADLVIPVPDSGTPAAIGFAEQAGLHFDLGLIRSHYVGRTFIEPRQSIRHFGVKLKLSAVSSALRGKRVVVVDDSIVRGTTSRKIIKMIRSAGAREIHMRISSPPTAWPCFYGIDTPTRQELIAASHSIEETMRYITADSLGYISTQQLAAAIGEKGTWCDACFSGNYPIEFPQTSSPES